MRDADQSQLIAAVASVALVLGAGLGVLLFGASRRRVGGDMLPGNLALDDSAALADDGGASLVTQDETGVDAGDWYAMRQGAGGADAVIGEGEGEHVPTDLASGRPRPERAVQAFRPDRDAAVLPAERDAFAPATKPVPSRVEAMGNGDED